MHPHFQEVLQQISLRLSQLEAENRMLTEEVAALREQLEQSELQ